MIPETIPVAVTALGIIYLGATYAICSLLTISRKGGRNLQKPFTRNGTAAVSIIVAGSILTLI